MGPYDSCWCRSGKKYKWCHFRREQQKPINIFEIEAGMIAEFRDGYCSHPDPAADPCSATMTKARTNLQDFRLDPDRIARACGISTRYLHELFKDTGQTVRHWIREQRLAACREALEDPDNIQTAAEIAYSWGFNDQTQFSRAFKAQFGLPPGEHRENARARWSS
ncbi:helix-turn-helix domain-containing protein [Brucella ovis]|nr:helix-turn-helix transcriptional regulator [Brucella ovis]